MKRHLFVLLFAGVAVLALAAACGDDGDGGGDGGSAEVTFNGSDCAYSGPETVSAGKVIVFDNQSERSARLDVGKLDEGRTLDDLVEASAELGSEAESAGRPPWITGGTIFESLAGESATRDLAFPPGNYSLICLQDSAFTGALLTIE